jgi:membrane-associated phospholipid phosphatase
MPVFIMAVLATWVDAPLIQMVYEHRTVAIRDLAINVSKIAGSQFFTITAVGVYAASLTARSIAYFRSWELLLERLVRSSLLMLLALLTGGLVTFALKHIVARGRPFLLLESGFYGISMPFTGAPFHSFPSSHSFTAFGVAFALAKVLPAWRTPLLFTASMVALSRVIALEHFVSDVVASAFIATWCVNIWSRRVLDGQSNWALRQPWRWRGE